MRKRFFLLFTVFICLLVLIAYDINNNVLGQVSQFPNNFYSSMTAMVSNYSYTYSNSYSYYPVRMEDLYTGSFSYPAYKSPYNLTNIPQNNGTSGANFSIKEFQYLGGQSFDSIYYYMDIPLQLSNPFVSPLWANYHHDVFTALNQN